MIIITAGPSFEPLDNVRRITNMSTGRLGTELAQYLVDNTEDEVCLLRGSMASYPCSMPNSPQFHKYDFDTPNDLLKLFRQNATEKPCTIFHAAAVNDFGFGKIFEKDRNGTLREIPESTKYATHGNVSSYFVELRPTVKILPQLRALFPQATIVGWKYETEGNQADLLAKVEYQIEKCKTDFCILNGPAFEQGFGTKYVIISKNRSRINCSNMDLLFKSILLHILK